jgi:hypothetical protein
VVVILDGDLAPLEVALLRQDDVGLALPARDIQQLGEFGEFRFDFSAFGWS